MNSSNSIFITLLFCILSSAVCASNKQEGTAGGAFLNITPTPRAAAMGGAYTAVSDDVGGLFSNPAGIIQVNYPEVEGLHSEWISDIQYEFLGGVVPVGFNGVFGSSLIYLHTKDTVRQSPGTIGSEFTNYDFAYNASFAYLLPVNLSVGLSAKYIRQKLAESTSSSVAFDMGLFYVTAVPNLNLGFSVANIGSKVKFITDEFSLPLTFRGGVSYSLLRDKLLLAFDVNKRKDTSIRSQFGAEYKIRPNVIIRAGSKFGYDIKGLSAITAGATFKYRSISFNYAFEDYSKLGGTHRISTSYKFGEK